MVQLVSGRDQWFLRLEWLNPLSEMIESTMLFLPSTDSEFYHLKDPIQMKARTMEKVSLSQQHDMTHLQVHRAQH